MKNTTNRKFTALIGELESSRFPQVEVSKSNLAAARDYLPQAEVEREEAEDRLTDVEGSFKALLDEFTTADHAEATSALRRAQLREVGAKAAVDRAVRLLLSSDTSLAASMARVVEKGMPGVTAIATFVRPKEAPGRTELPLALVIQTTASTNKEGSLSGDVEIEYHRGDIHVPLNADALTNAARDLGMEIEAKGGVRSDSDGRRDVLAVRIHFAHETVPVIACIEDRNLIRLGRIVAAGLADECRYQGLGIQVDSRSQAYVTSHVIVLPLSAVLVTEEYDPDGQRTLVVDSTVLVRVKQQPSGPPVRRRMEDLIEDMNQSGTFVSGLGVIDSLQWHLDASDESGTSHLLDEATPAPRDSSTVGFEDDLRYVLRCVLRSSRHVSIAA